MRTNEHLAARAVAAVGLMATAAYLVWRVGSSIRGVPAWLSLPLLAVEIVGFVGAVLLTWALWPMPTGAAGRATADTDDDWLGGRVDVVVRVDGQAVHEVRATILALRSVAGAGRVLLADLSRSPEIRDLAATYDLGLVAIDAGHDHELAAIARTVATPWYLLLDAGDIPATDIVGRLAAEIGPHTAIVQGRGVCLADDSPGHAPDGRLELAFEYLALNPSLGRRGVAMWTGSGSLVRTTTATTMAGRAATPQDSPLAACWKTGAALVADGWSVAAPLAAVMSTRPPVTDAEVERDRTRRARAARQLLVGPGGALSRGGGAIAPRLAAAAWSVRPLSGLRRIVFIAVVCAALLSGLAPFRASAAVVAFGWLPAFGLTSLGISLLSGWTLRPGDRTRWSLRSMGPFVESLRPERPTRGHEIGLVVGLGAMTVALALRGISEQVTHSLAQMPRRELMALVVVCLWLVGLSLDQLRLLARRTPMRRSARVGASMGATLGDREVSVVDLTQLGAGVLARHGATAGDRLVLETNIATLSGVTSVRVPAIVRNASNLHEAGWRLGLEFLDTDTEAADALAEYCVIGPSWTALGNLPGRQPVDVHHDGAPPTARHTHGRTRLLAIVALVGAGASAAPGFVEADDSYHVLEGTVLVGEPPVPVEDTTTTAAPDTTAPPATTVTTDTSAVAVAPPDPGEGVAGVVVVGVCSLAPGPDGIWGSSDDEYTSPVSDVTGPDGTYRIELTGDACWAIVDPPSGFDQLGAASGTPQVVDLSRSTQRADVTVRPASPRPATPPAPAVPAVPAATASLGDTVWHDGDGNGVQDQGEPGVPGVHLVLLDAANTVLARTTSDPDGHFHFGGLGAGDYRVQVSNVPGGLTLDAVARGTDRATDSDVDAITGRSPSIALVDGERLDSVDIGLRDRATGSPTATGRATDQVLPMPGAGQLGASKSGRDSQSIVVFGVAALLAFSLLLGGFASRRPQQLRR